MKKLTLISLALIIAISTVLCCGCKKKEELKIIDFYPTYLEIANSSEQLTTSSIPTRFNSPNMKKCVSFVYSTELLEAMSNSPYKEIDTIYNTLLDDIMGPVYLYAESLVEAKISKNEKHELFSKLENIKTGYIEVAQRFGDLERILKESNALDDISIVALTNLYASYESLLDNATKLSKQVYSIYFNRVLANSNPDYLSQNINEIDLEDLATLALNKKIYFLSVYADIYLHLEIIGKNVPNQIIAKTFNAEYLPYKTLSNKSYKKSLLLNIEENRNVIVENAIALQLIQTDFDKFYTNYQKAISKIIYSQVNSSSSKIEQGYKQIVDSFTSNNGIVFNSLKVLINILDNSFQQN